MSDSDTQRDLLVRCLTALNSRAAASKSVRLLRSELRAFLDSRRAEHPPAALNDRTVVLCPRCANRGRSDDCPECQGRVAWYSKPANEAFTEWYCRNPYENLSVSTASWMAFKAGRDHATKSMQVKTTQR